MKVRRRSVDYRAELGPGGVDLWLRAGDLAANLVKAFRISPNAVRLESTGSDPGVFQLVVYLFDVGMAIRYRSDALAIGGSFGEQRTSVLGSPAEIEALETALGILRETAPAAEVVTQRTLVNAHIDLRPETVASILDRFSTAPQRYRPTSFTMECSLQGEGKGTALLEESAEIPAPHGLFLQIGCYFPGATPASLIQTEGLSFLDEASRLILNGTTL